MSADFFQKILSGTLSQCRDSVSPDLGSTFLQSKEKVNPYHAQYLNKLHSSPALIQLTSSYYHV